MYKYVFLLSLLVSSFYGNAQKFTQPHAYVGAGLSLTGANVGVEAGYRITDLVAVSLKGEYSLLVLDAKNFNEGDLGIITSCTGNIRLYWDRDSSHRKYVGFGVGLYQMQFGKTTQSKMGFYPRFGVDNNHFNLNIDFNIVPMIDYGPVDVQWEVMNVGNSNHLTVRIGLMIGGGKY